MKLFAPTYFYPGTRPELWSRLIEAADLLDWVVINCHDGPGSSTDPAWSDQCSRLSAAGVRQLGYVHLDYGRRDIAEIVADVHAWVSRHELRSIFLDCLPSQAEARVEQVARAARAAGATTLIGNPGVKTSEAIAELLDGVVEWEATAAATAAEPGRDTAGRDSRTWIVHSADWETARRLVGRGLSDGVHSMWLTDLAGSNPYRALPSYWDRLVSLIRLDANAAVATVTGKPAEPQ